MVFHSCGSFPGLDQSSFLSSTTGPLYMRSLHQGCSSFVSLLQSHISRNMVLETLSKVSCPSCRRTVSFRARDCPPNRR